jgi:hypothetical protein
MHGWRWGTGGPGQLLCADAAWLCVRACWYALVAPPPPSDTPSQQGVPRVGASNGAGCAHAVSLCVCFPYIVSVGDKGGGLYVHVLVCWLVSPGRRCRPWTLCPTVWRPAAKPGCP